MGVYKWKDGSRFRANAEMVASELNGLTDKTPGAVLQKAEDDQTELHKCFTWEDAKAAHLYRLEEARRVVRSVIEINEAPDREPIEHRAFEYITIQPEEESEKPRRVFVSTTEALSNKDTRKEVFGRFRSAIAELSSEMKVYRYLAEEEIDAAQHHLDLAREAVTV